MMNSRILSKTIGKRFFSAGAENPRVKIAENLLKYRAIQAATNEAALTAALNGNYTVNVSNLQPEIAELKDYLSAAPVTEEFKADPSYWHNKPFFDRVKIDLSREYTWPFLVGGVLTVLLFSYLDANLPEGGKEKSQYYQLLNGTYFDHEFGKDKAHGHEEAHHH